MSAHSEESHNIEKLAPQLTEGGTLSRQMTLQISPEQYERLFFQPTPARGDLAKKLGNPTLVGVAGFLLPFTTTVMCLLDFRGASAASFASISGSWLFIGGIAMNIAGICEFILGNTFPFAIFVIYGCHWINLAYTVSPLIGIAASYTMGTVPGADSVAYTAGQGFYNITMALTSFGFWLGTLRTNVPLSLAIFCLIFLFSFTAAAEFAIGSAVTLAQQEHVLYLLKIAGGFGFVTLLAGWYLFITLSCASTGVWCPLPAMDLSTVVLPGTKAAKLERGTASRGGDDAV
ncbi:GPR1/FUN34/YaaH-class plasma membrane protein-like protein [Saccharata proteae CBS 121410]|uniref:GPR1/FUN34/YaaH-class plasma membrane protein-like protein n=1 Tax=Saccharata proteae CBS 121410 TaxID=1314787 RepID=A0A6A5YCP6_9PEZI|nr:GPR1/FUN34/YaaH-class plasma membrane protein-like protein [Saccharata proteae CBS 121410]